MEIYINAYIHQQTSIIAPRKLCQCDNTYHHAYNGPS